MVSFRWLLIAVVAMVVACAPQPEQSKIGTNNQSAGGNASVPEDACYPSKPSSLQITAESEHLRLASEAYEQINTNVLKVTCAANACHGPESDFRPWVDNEPNFRRVAARVRFRILNKLRRHYFPPDKISDDNYRLMKTYVDSVPDSQLPNGCQVDYRP